MSTVACFFTLFFFWKLISITFITGTSYTKFDHIFMVFVPQRILQYYARFSTTDIPNVCCLHFPGSTRHPRGIYGCRYLQSGMHEGAQIE